MEITTPGRVCLFGEHQDYLGLPVIAMAISLRANMSGEKRSDRKVIIHKPDIGEVETFSLDDLSYNKPRDYFKRATKIEARVNSAINAGAYGRKINGSGGCGCMFAYAPKDSESVALAIESVVGKAYIIYADDGI